MNHSESMSMHSNAEKLAGILFYISLSSRLPFNDEVFLKCENHEKSLVDDEVYALANLMRLIHLLGVHCMHRMGDESSKQLVNIPYVNLWKPSLDSQYCFAFFSAYIHGYN